jgi:hypothetical protein
LMAMLFADPPVWHADDKWVARSLNGQLVNLAFDDRQWRVIGQRRIIHDVGTVKRRGAAR